MNMEQLIHVSVSINSDMSIKETKIETIDVLKTNDFRMVLDNDFFTVLNLKKEKYTTNANLDEVEVLERKDRVMIDIFGRFNIDVYSTKSLKITENRINRIFNQWLADKLAIYGHNGKVTIKLEGK